MRRKMLRCAVVGMFLFAAPGPFITFVPRYNVAGQDISWMIGTALLALIGAAVGAGFAVLAFGTVRLTRATRQ
jgi:hypothetical protein